MIWNILPINDVMDHSEFSTCDCNPEALILDNGNIIIIHNAFDNREIIEQLNEIIDN